MRSFRGMVYLLGWLFLLLGVAPLLISAVAGWTAEGRAARWKRRSDQTVTCMIGGREVGNCFTVCRCCAGSGCSACPWR